MTPEKGRRSRPDSPAVAARKQLTALGIVRQIGVRDGQPVWGAVPPDDVPAIGRRYLALSREGRFAEAEKIVQEALEMPGCTGCGIGTLSHRGDVALCEACARAREEHRA